MMKLLSVVCFLTAKVSSHFEEDFKDIDFGRSVMLFNIRIKLIVIKVGFSRLFYDCITPIVK